MPDHDDLDLTTNFTIMAWFCPSDSIIGRQLMTKNDSIFVIFDFANSKSLDFLVKPNNEFVESNTREWSIGEWYHFAGTFDGGKLKIYINGILENEKGNPIPVVPSSFDFWIGADDYNPSRDGFVGKIDDVRIYGKALNEAEIQEAMNDPAEPVDEPEEPTIDLDVNDDGFVNIQDLVLVAVKFGEEVFDDPADVNGDGVVNIVDLVLVAHALS